MADFLITYDVSDDHRSEKLREILEQLGAAHVQESVWHISDHINNSQSLHFLLGAGLDLHKDRLLIAPVSPASTWAGFNDLSGLL
jgi:CRISPR-associated endonuclease Cas2